MWAHPGKRWRQWDAHARFVPKVPMSALSCHRPRDAQVRKTRRNAVGRHRAAQLSAKRMTHLLRGPLARAGGDRRRHWIATNRVALAPPRRYRVSIPALTKASAASGTTPAFPFFMLQRFGIHTHARKTCWRHPTRSRGLPAPLRDGVGPSWAQVGRPRAQLGPKRRSSRASVGQHMEIVQKSLARRVLEHSGSPRSTV